MAPFQATMMTRVHTLGHHGNTLPLTGPPWQHRAPHGAQPLYPGTCAHSVASHRPGVTEALLQLCCSEAHSGRLWAWAALRTSQPDTEALAACSPGRVGSMGRPPMSQTVLWRTSISTARRSPLPWSRSFSPSPCVLWRLQSLVRCCGGSQAGRTVGFTGS